MAWLNVFFQEPSYIGHDIFALPSNVLHQKERIRVCQCYHGNSFHHILATDYSLLMVDERFPTRPVGIRTNAIWAVTCDFQQCGILTSVDSDKPVQPTFKLRNSKWWSVNRLTFIEYSSDQQRLWSDCAYAQAYLRLCWSHIPHCWKSHAAAHMVNVLKFRTLIACHKA